MKYLIHYCLAILSISFAHGQVGRPFIQSFSPSDYQAHTQNWSIVQDSSGRIYAGNNFGVLVFDGNAWDLIPTDNNTTVRSLAYHPELNRVYVGAQNSIGYLKANLQGELNYISLMDRLDSAIQASIKNVWETRYLDGEIYFRTDEYLIAFDQQLQPSVWKGDAWLHRSFTINNQLYVVQDTIGLCIATDNGIQAVESGELFGFNRIYSLLPYDEQYSLAATRSGFVLFDLQTGKSRPFEADEAVSESTIYNGIQLSNGLYAYATLGEGVFLMDKKGKVQQHLDTSKGLLDDVVINLVEDAQGGLWMGLNNGISRAEIQSPISYWNEEDGLGSGVNCIRRFKGMLYVGTDVGLFVLGENQQFSIPHESFDGLQVWSLGLFKIPQSEEELLIVNTTGGTYYLKDGKLHDILGITVFESLQLNKYPDRLYLGAELGVALVTYQDGKFTNTKGYIGEVNATVRSLKADKEGNVWAITSHEGARKLSPTGSVSKEAKHVTEPLVIDSFPGLKNLKDIYAYHVNDELLLATTQGLYSIDGDQAKPYSLLGKQYEGGESEARDIFQLSQNKEGEIWLVGAGSESSPFAAFSKQGESLSQYAALERMPSQAPQCIYHDDDGSTWIGGSLGVFKYDRGQALKNAVAFPALTRQVLIGEDSLLFGGYSQKANTLSPRLGYEHNSLTFMLAAPQYDGLSQNLFSHQLYPYEKGWSKWSSDHKKEYTNLPEGQYTFKVKVLNAYSQESPEGIYHFEVQPPWYRSIAAYISYVICLGLLIWVSARFYNRKLRREKETLERIVVQRTEEISRQHDDILEKNTELEQQNEEIAAQRDLLDDQHAAISQKNVQITASINYAERIQRAMLPNERQIQQVWANSFVLFKPRDIVSGDFYWFAEKDGKKIVAAVDCTGHGVPGAFMSMIGEALLREAITEKAILSPKEILHYMDIGINNILKQSEGDNRDGMDMSICVIDLENNSLLFAGARNPLIMVDNGEIHILKGTKRSVGGDHRATEPVFEEQSLSLPANSMLYLFSDGYADQFGGPKNRKFMVKQLKKMFLSIAHLPVAEQQSTLNEKIDNWMREGEEKQVDDILVIGLSTEGN